MTSDVSLTYDIKKTVGSLQYKKMLNLTFGLVNIWVITWSERAPVNVALFIRPRGLVEK